MSADEPALHDQLRTLTPRVLAALARHNADFAAVEDAVQEALLAAYRQWPQQGTPASPSGWLITVATRRLHDAVRSEDARRRREALATRLDPATAGAPRASAADDTLELLVLCCHPCLPPASQTALTLRAVAGLTTQEIAKAFLLPEATLSKRITRAKQKIREAGGRFGEPDEAALRERLPQVRHVLYLVFREGYASTAGPDLQRPELTAEAIRLTTALHRALPGDGETSGLLALMQLLDSRRGARIRPDGSLVPLAEQDRRTWDQRGIAAAIRLLTDTLSSAPLGPYQLQAAIAAVHAEAATAEDTDWQQIEGLYNLLAQIWPSPMVALNQAVAAAMVHGPNEGLRHLSALAFEPSLRDHHRMHAVRAHLLEQAGELQKAYDAYREAARLTISRPEQVYLLGRARALVEVGVVPPRDSSRTD